MSFTLKPNKNSNGHSPLRVVIVFTVVILGIDVIAVDDVFTVIVVIIISIILVAIVPIVFWFDGLCFTIGGSCWSLPGITGYNVTRKLAIVIKLSFLS